MTGIPCLTETHVRRHGTALSYHLTNWHSSAPRQRRSAETNHLPPSICNLGKLLLLPFIAGPLKDSLLQMLEKLVERGKEENYNHSEITISTTHVYTHTHTQFVLIPCMQCERLCGSRLQA